MPAVIDAADDPRWSALHVFLAGQTTLAQVPASSVEAPRRGLSLSGGDAEPDARHSTRGPAGATMPLGGRSPGIDFASGMFAPN